MLEKCIMFDNTEECQLFIIDYYNFFKYKDMFCVDKKDESKIFDYQLTERNNSITKHIDYFVCLTFEIDENSLSLLQNKINEKFKNIEYLERCYKQKCEVKHDK